MSISEMMDTAVAIVQRYNERGNVLPSPHEVCGDDLAKRRENTDYKTLNQWISDDSRCPSQVTSYLDSNMAGWRGPLYYMFLPKAQHIVEYYELKRNFIAPSMKADWAASKQEFQEYRALCESKAFISGQKFREGECPPSIIAHLNREAPNWLSIGQCKVFERLDDSFVKAEGIVQRYISRGGTLPKEWRNHQGNPERAQEYKDAQKLSKWKETLKRAAEGRGGKGGHSCPPQLQAFLDTHLVGWRTEVRDKNIPPMERAQGIVARYRERGNVIPRQLVDRTGRPDRQQEFKDAVRLKDWKRALRAEKGGGGGKCDEDVKQYLDTNMPGWRSRVYVKHQRGDMYGEEPKIENKLEQVSSAGAGGHSDSQKGSSFKHDDSNVISISIASRTYPREASAANGGNNGYSGSGRVLAGPSHVHLKDTIDNANVDIASSARDLIHVRDSSVLKRSGEDGAEGQSSQKRPREREEALEAGGSDMDEHIRAIIRGQGQGFSSGRLSLQNQETCSSQETAVRGHLSPGGQLPGATLNIQSPPPDSSAGPSSSSSSSSSSARLYNTHDDKEISAAAGLVAAYSPRV
mmetsp:Transcript_21204/g.35717  ORF Transcript_21204/g.35717 Transcript_21204/m.35717 type:complete len:577 (-) Transcript_21204:180-1910(-)